MANNVAQRAVPILPELSSRSVRLVESACRKWGHAAPWTGLSCCAAGLILWVFRDIDLAIAPCSNASWDCEGLLVDAREALAALAILAAASFLAFARAIRSSRRAHARWINMIQARLREADLFRRDVFVRTWLGPDAALTRLRTILHVLTWTGYWLVAASVILFALGFQLVEERRRTGLVIRDEYLVLGFVSLFLFHRLRKHSSALTARFHDLLGECEAALGRVRGGPPSSLLATPIVYRPWAAPAERLLPAKK